MDQLTLPAIGLVVGFVVGLTGMGGGVIMTPLLLLVFSMPPSLAVGTDLAYSVPTKIVGAWQHFRLGTVDLDRVRWLAFGSVPAAVVAVALLGVFRKMPWIEQGLRRSVGLALLLAAGLMLYRLFRPEVGIETGAIRPVPLVAVGAIGGFLVGLTSVGSGSIMMALLILLAPLPSRRLVGTDVFHAALLVFVSALGHAALGHIDFSVAGRLLIGSIPGVVLGARLSSRAPRRFLQVALATLLVLAGLKLTA